MRQYHMISAKRMGWDTIYDYYPFPTDKYSEESVRNQFKKITRETQKNNGVFVSVKLSTHRAKKSWN